MIEGCRLLLFLFFRPIVSVFSKTVFELTFSNTKDDAGRIPKDFQLLPAVRPVQPGQAILGPLFPSFPWNLWWRADRVSVCGPTPRTPASFHYWGSRPDCPLFSLLGTIFLVFDLQEVYQTHADHPTRRNTYATLVLWEDPSAWYALFTRIPASAT